MLRRGLRISLSFLAAAALLYFFFQKLDHRRILDHMGEARPFWLAATVLLQGLHLTLRSLRWRILLSPMKKGVGFYNLFATTTIGYLLSFAFFRIGELLRPLMLGQREGISRSGTLATCVLERLMDAFSVALLFGVYLIFLFEPPAAGTGHLDMDRLRRAGVLLGLAALCSFPVLYGLVHYRHRLFAWMEARRAGRQALLPRLLHGFLGGFDAVRGGRIFTLAWLQSIGIWLVITASIWVSLKAFDLDVGYGDSLLMLALLNIGIAVPTPGAAGSYEVMGQLGLVDFFGVEPNRAAAAILVTHAFAIGPVMILGVALLWREGLGLRGLWRISREPGEAARPAGASR